MAHAARNWIYHNRRDLMIIFLQKDIKNILTNYFLKFFWMNAVVSARLGE